MSGLEALSNVQLDMGRERGGEWEEALYKRLHQSSELWPLKCHHCLMWVAQGNIFVELMTCHGSYSHFIFLQLYLVNLKHRNVLTFAIWSSDVFPSWPENSPRAVGVEEISVVFLSGSQLCSVL